MAEKFVKYLMLPVAVLLFLPGSVARRPKPSFPVVCRVEVDCRQGTVHQHRHYTSSEKMGWVLNFMRMQKNLGCRRQTISYMQIKPHVVQGSTVCFV